MSGHGIDIQDQNISCILFADDIVLFGKSEEDLRHLMKTTLRFFSSHHLQISHTKSKVMFTNSKTGNMCFHDPHKSPSTFNLEQVLSFKYLGIPISANPYSMFKSFNAHVVKKAHNYLQSVLSLVKSGPDKTDLAYMLWTRVALPAILYGTEIFPLTQHTLGEIEKCQSKVGKFILQIPRTSTNVTANIDAGLRPVWSLVEEKFLLFAQKTLSQPRSYWPKLAMEEQITLGDRSPYTRTLIKYKTHVGAFGLPPSQIKKVLLHNVIGNVINERERFSVSLSSMSLPKQSGWFQKKAWVTDSAYSKIFAEFRACDAGLGNRGPTRDGQFFKLCPLCDKVFTSQVF